MQAENAIRTERPALPPSSDERDLGEYRRHLTDPDEFSCQYGLRMGDDVLDAIDFHGSGVIHYTVFLGGGGPMVGYVGINPFGGDGGVEGELEFHTFREHRGRGYCTEASAALPAAFFGGGLACGRGARLRRGHARERPDAPGAREAGLQARGDRHVLRAAGRRGNRP